MFLAFLLAAAAPAELQAVRDLAALDLKVARLGDRLARAGLCNARLSGPGWVLQDLSQYNPSLRPAAAG